MMSGQTPFLTSPTLFTQIDQQETRSRSWPLNYFRESTNSSAYGEFSRRYYGYYFKVLLDRMAQAFSMPETCDPQPNSGSHL